MNRSFSKPVLSVSSLILAICIAGPAWAGSRSSATDGAAQIRIGGFFPDFGGDMWEANESVFTLDKSDFNEAILGFSYVYPVDNHFDVGINLDFYNSEVLSADRDYVDEFGSSILHDTELNVVPLSVDVRFIPAGRYRQRGNRNVKQPVFYLGGGIGVSYWEYEEIGDFTDDATDPLDPVVFPWRYKDSGASFQYHALSGVELPMGRNFNLMLEGRYTWSDANPDRSYVREFVGADDLEIGGAAIFLGGSWHF